MLKINKQLENYALTFIILAFGLCAVWYANKKTNAQQSQEEINAPAAPVVEPTSQPNLTIQNTNQPSTNAELQQPSDSPTAIRQTAQNLLPLLPLQIEYEYVPSYFMQWLPGHSKYSQIEASFSDAEAQIITLVLTEKTSGRRVNYCNSEARVKALTNAGEAARIAKIDYRTSNKLGQLPAHEFAFTDEQNQPVRWRFTMAAPVSEQGAGLTPQENGAGWVLIYRDLGTAAGAGTAVQIGDQTITADAWTEISSPPYFIAYRGVYADGIGIAVILPVEEKWRVAASPADLKTGAKWTFENERGQTKNFQVTEASGDELTVKEIGSQQSSPVETVMKLKQSAKGLLLRSVTLTSKNKTMQLNFSSDLDFNASTPATVAFQINQNGHNKILHGSVSVEKKDDVVNLRWQPKSPDWAKSRVLNSSIRITR
jgi:hypothetical protein